jgi:hypothetical protein
MTPAKKSSKRVTPAKKDVPVLAVEGEQNVIWHTKVGDQLLVARIDTFKGKTALDIRRFYYSDENKWNPTSKGVRIPVEQVPSMLANLSNEGWDA